MYALTSFDDVGSSFGNVISFLYLLLIPFILAVMLQKHARKLGSPNVKTRIGALYLNVRTEHVEGLFYLPFYLIRRFLFSLTIIGFSITTSLQISGNIFMSFLNLGFLGIVMPF